MEQKTTQTPTTVLGKQIQVDVNQTLKDIADVSALVSAIQGGDFDKLGKGVATVLSDFSTSLKDGKATIVDAIPVFKEIYGEGHAIVKMIEGWF